MQNELSSFEYAVIESPHLKHQEMSEQNLKSLHTNVQQQNYMTESTNRRRLLIEKEVFSTPNSDDEDV
jgi:hypothetical protein